MQSHGGNITALPDFLCTRVVLLSENHAVRKIAHNHGDNRITKPGSKELTERPHLVHSDDASPLVTIMARHPDPPIAQKLLLWKNTHFHPNSWTA
jgi:hypothetical protein